MIRDVIVSIGRVGTLAVLRFLQSSPEIIPTSWFDLPTVRRHWAALDHASRRFLIMVHHSSEVSILNSASSQVKVTWNTRCPFASARSSVNWRIFQDIILHDGQPSKHWTEMVNEDDLCGFYPDIAQTLRGHDLLIVDISELSATTPLGYEKIARHHGISMSQMEVPYGIQSGDFETFLFSYRFILNGISYMIMPAKGITWLRKDMHVGSIDGSEVFPEHYNPGRVLSVYAEMDRPDSEWKKEFSWDNFIEKKQEISEPAYACFERYKKVFSEYELKQDNHQLEKMVNHAFGYRIGHFVDQVPVFQKHWNTGKISAHP